MITREQWCEDCSEVVTVFGDTERGTPWFVEFDRDGHEGHDLSEPRNWGKVLDYAKRKQ